MDRNIPSNLRSQLERIAEELICGVHSPDDAHYCPNCDNSLFGVRAKVRALIAALPVETGCSACAKHEKDMEQELEARDGNAAYADQLTAMIGVYFETDHGEHSNLNDPWENAIETMRVAIGTKPEHQKTAGRQAGSSGSSGN